MVKSGAMSFPRVVVTGLGVITPIGLTIADFWSNLVAGRSGVRHITRFDTSRHPYKLAAEVEGFDPLKYMDAKQASRMSRYSQMAVAAASMAVQMAGIDIKTERPERAGVVVATLGQVRTIHELAVYLERPTPPRVDPLFLHKTGHNMAAVQVGRHLGFRGPNSSVNSACASGADAIGAALNFIRLGKADVMVAGGTDDTVGPVSVLAMGMIGAVSKATEPGTAPKPFDLNRDGSIVGEGAGMLVLETEDHARRRGARVLAELAGTGWSFDAYNEVAPDPEGEALAIKAALDDAGLQPEDIQHVNAHGTATRLNDAAETKALKLALGDHAYKVTVSANKSITGHLSCGAGAVESVASVLTIVNGIIPPTINYRTPDPECDLDYVPNTARRASVETCLKNSFGLGGQNCCLIFRRMRGER
ncbi:MAG: beta-ketoacyl-ACP synthase II [Dehalococcoidia bacterium]|nr:beta-ketoacyl-ACP synthase II [Dehalococcoidia bacterium]